MGKGAVPDCGEAARSHRCLTRHTLTAGTAVRVLTFLLLFVDAAPGWSQARDRYASRRDELVRKFIVGTGISDPRVIESIRHTPRHEFVPVRLRDRAYFDMALPIGDSQTISSPFIVAFMTESLRPQPTDRVLEIGTGSGYQAAVLSPLVKDVYSIEIVPSLSARARRVIRRLKLRNVHLKVGDGYQGWAEHAPFDKVIVTCSPEQVPSALVEQLREGGRMVVPVGQRYQQTLYLFRKQKGELQAEALRPTLFVPMTGTAETRRQVLPDPTQPRAVNGDFEAPPQNNELTHFPGWYYQRQVQLVSHARAPQGSRFVSFSNQDPGRFSHALQGFGIDGRQVKRLRLSAQVRLRKVRPGPEPNMRPAVLVTLYDAKRRELAQLVIGPWSGDMNWSVFRRTFPVPPATREGILRIGLFGATGELDVDDVEMERVEE